MTDNDIIKIIKALECQLGLDDSCNCYGCLCREDKSCINASERVLEAVRDLINSQKAEIEKLTINMNAFGLGVKREKERADTIRTEAIKEFADKIKGKLDISVCGYSSEEVISDVVDTIDNIVKELTENQT